MTDPTGHQNGEANEEQVNNFGYWLCMLPFVVGAGVFSFLWWQHRSDAAAVAYLMYALGTLVVGIVITGLINGAAGGDTTRGGTGSSSS